MRLTRRAATAVLVSMGLAGLVTATACSSDDDEGGASDDLVDEQGGEPSGDWTTVTDQESGISIEMPGSPDEQDLDAPLPGGGTMPVRNYLVELGDQGSDGAVSFAVYEPPGGSAAFDLQGSAQGSAEGAGGTLTSTTPTTYEGREALDSEMNLTQGGVEGVGLMRVLKATDANVVLVQVIGAADDDNLRPMFDRVVGSLQAGGGS